MNPASQYATDANLRARQRLWGQQQPRFDIVGWVLDVAGLGTPCDRFVLDVGCGNGMYLRELGQATSRRSAAPGLQACSRRSGLILALSMATWYRSHSAMPFDVVLAPHMLYHVEDRQAAVAELRRDLRSAGCCVVVTNGEKHMRSLQQLVEAAVRKATPTWEMRNPSTHAFSMENGEAQLGQTPTQESAESDGPTERCLAPFARYSLNRR